MATNATLTRLILLLVALLSFSNAAASSSTLTNVCPRPTPYISKPKDLRCGGHYDPINKQSALDSGIITQISFDCAYECRVSGRCQSFTYTADPPPNNENGTCVRYGRTGKYMGLQKASRRTEFWNIGCWDFRDYYTPAEFLLNNDAGYFIETFNDGFVLGTDQSGTQSETAKFTLINKSNATQGTPVQVTGPGSPPPHLDLADEMLEQHMTVLRVFRPGSPHSAVSELLADTILALVWWD